MYSVEFSKTAERQFDKLEREVQERVINAIERIKLRPFDFVERLVASPYFKLRVGDYRIIMDIKRDRLIIFVLELGHRRNIYKS